MQSQKSVSPVSVINLASDRIDWLNSIPFFLLHLGALVGLFFFPIGLKGVLICAVLYVLRMFGVTAGYHRYFAHRTYKTSRVFQFLLAFLATTSFQKGVMWWAAHHRDHHRNSDKPSDIHSPIQRGFWWSHVGWILSSSYDETEFSKIRDFTKYPELVFLNKFYLIPPFAMGILLLALGGLEAFYWGFLLSTVFLLHGTFTINSLSHVWGKRRFNTSDQSRNNFLLALITLGEGWHNNHHHYMNSTKQGFYWYEIDITFYVLVILSKLGIVWDLRDVPSEVLNQKN
ncbi:MAG: acyl-CoA desaturase [Bacteriovoracia bacterium]